MGAGGAGKAGFADPPRAVDSQMADDFAASHAGPDERDVGEVEVLDQQLQVTGQGLVVIAVPGLGGTTESAPVVGDDPVPAVDQRPDLPFPSARARRPAVHEDDQPALP